MLIEGVRGEVKSSAPSSILLDSETLPWKWITVQAICIWLVTRLIFGVVTYVARTAMFPGSVATPHTLILGWNQWDAAWYRHIALSGYHNDATAAFFPLYPMLVAAITWIIGQQHILFAMLLVSNLGSLATYIGLGLLAWNENHTDDSAWRAVVLLAAFPVQFFLAAGYGESVFLAFATFGLLASRRGWWLTAAVCGFFAALARSAAAALVLVYLYEYCRQHDWWRNGQWRALLKPRALLDVAALIVSVPVGFGLFMYFLWRKFGDPLIFYHKESQLWGREPLPLWSTVAVTLQKLGEAKPWGYDQASILLDAGSLLFLIVVVVLMARRMPVSLTLYCAFMIYYAISSPVPVVPDPLYAVRRYVLVAVPIFVILERWCARYHWLELLLVSGGFMLEAVFLVTFMSGNWVG